MEREEGEEEEGEVRSYSCSWFPLRRQVMTSLQYPPAEPWQSQMVGESACLMERQHQTQGHWPCACPGWRLSALRVGLWKELWKEQ